MVMCGDKLNMEFLFVALFIYYLYLTSLNSVWFFFSEVIHGLPSRIKWWMAERDQDLLLARALIDS